MDEFAQLTVKYAETLTKRIEQAARPATAVCPDDKPADPLPDDVNVIDVSANYTLLPAGTRPQLPGRVIVSQHSITMCTVPNPMAHHQPDTFYWSPKIHLDNYGNILILSPIKQPSQYNNKYYFRAIYLLRRLQAYPPAVFPLLSLSLSWEFHNSNYSNANELTVATFVDMTSPESLHDMGSKQTSNVIYMLSEAKYLG